MEFEVLLMVNDLTILVSNTDVLLTLVRRIRLCCKYANDVDLTAGGPIINTLYLTNCNSVLD